MGEQRVPEVEARKRFLQAVHAKVIKAPEHEAVKGAEHAVVIKNRIERAREATMRREAMGKEAIGG